MFTEKVSVIRNYHEGDFILSIIHILIFLHYIEGDFNAPVRYETYTSDGPGGAYPITNNMILMINLMNGWLHWSSGNQFHNNNSGIAFECQLWNQ